MANRVMGAALHAATELADCWTGEASPAATAVDAGAAPAAPKNLDLARAALVTAKAKYAKHEVVDTDCAPLKSLEADFAKASDFNPDRFNTAEVENPFKWIAFGGGKHRCMGSAFALMQLKVIFAKLLMKYQFEAVGDPFIADYQAMVVAPRQPSRVTYRLR